METDPGAHQATGWEAVLTVCDGESGQPELHIDLSAPVVEEAAVIAGVGDAAAVSGADQSPATGTEADSSPKHPEGDETEIQESQGEARLDGSWRLNAYSPPVRKQAAPSSPHSAKAESSSAGKKAVEIRSSRVELNGVYAPLPGESWSGATVYRNRRSHMYMVWHPQPPRWKIVPKKIDTTEVLAHVDCPEGRMTLPCDASGSWSLSSEGEDFVECIFAAQTVVVSGRSGHNQRLNGVFVELAEDFGSFPAYFDKQKHMFIYRRPNKAAWVISNRLGPASRSGRGIIFAEVQDDAPQPHLITNPWTVCAWGSRTAEVDPHISIFLKADHVREGPAPKSLDLQCRARPAISGTYSLREGERVNDQVVYLRPKEGELPEKYLFWDGERWCVASDIGAEASKCDIRSQRREIRGRNHPDDAVWHGVEVLRGNTKEIDASLLGSLKGRTRSLMEQFT